MFTKNERLGAETIRMGVFATVVKNAVANLVRTGASWIVVLFLPPILVRVLDKPTYATWILILQVGAYVSLFDNGIQSAIGRFVARAKELQDRNSMQQALSSAGLILLSASLITIIAVFLCSWQLGHLFHGIPDSIVASAQKALVAIGMSLAVSLPFSVLAGAFLGLQMYEVNALAGSLGKLFGAAGAAYAAWRHEGLLAMALWIGLGNLLPNLIFWVYWKRLDLPGLLHHTYITGVALREFSRFCFAMFVTQLGSLLITGMDMPIVAAFDFHAAAFYAVAATVSNMLIVPHGAVVSTLIPVASGMSAGQTPERLGQVVMRTTRYASAILCLLTLPLLFAMLPFLRLWVGSEYAVHALPFAVILVIAQFIRLTVMPYAVVGFGAGEQQKMLISPLGEGIVNLGCSVLGALWFGALGVASGTLIGACFGVLLHFVNSMPRTSSMIFSRRQLVGTAILKPIACCLPSLLLMPLLMQWIHATTTEFALILAGEVLAAITLWKTNFDDNERIEMLVLARKVFNKLFRLHRIEA